MPFPWSFLRACNHLLVQPCQSLGSKVIRPRNVVEFRFNVKLSSGSHPHPAAALNYSSCGVSLGAVPQGRAPSIQPPSGACQDSSVDHRGQ